MQSHPGRGPGREPSRAFPKAARPRAEALERRFLLSAGEPDPSFSGDGRLVTALTSFFNGREVALQDDGRLVVAVDGGFLRRYNPDGSLDLNFGTDGTAVTQGNFGDSTGVADVLVQPDGKVLVVGSLAGGWYVGRLRPDGSHDSGFGGRAINAFFVERFLGNGGFATSVAVRPDGRIVVAGSVVLPAPGFGRAFGVAQYHPDGTPDLSFGDGGKAWVRFGEITETPEDVALTADGRIVLAGDINYSTVRPTRLGVVRFTAGGLLDDTFGAGAGKVVTDAGPQTHFTSVQVRPDGRILVGGTADPTGDVALVQLRPDGAPDPSFDGDGVLVLPRAATGHFRSATVLQADGRIVWANSADGDVAVYRFNPDGTPDAGYGSGGVAVADAGGRPDFTEDVAIRPDGRVVVVAREAVPGAPSFGGDTGLVQFKADPGPPLPEAGGPYTVAEGGAITLYGWASGDPDGDITAYEWDFDSDGVTFHVDATGPMPPFSAVGLDGPSSRTVALRVTDARGAARLDTAALSVTNVAPAVFIGGPGSVARGRPYVLSLSAGADPGADVVRHWDINWGDGQVERVEGNPPSASHVYTGAPGAVTITATVTDDDGAHPAARHDLDTSFGGGVVRTGFNVPHNDRAKVMAVQPDGKVVAAGESVFSGLSLLRLTPDGRPDPAFGAGGKVTVPEEQHGFEPRAIAVMPDGKIVAAGGRYRSIPTPTSFDFIVRRFNADGTPDASFGEGGFVYIDFDAGFDTATALVPLPDGRLVVAGRRLVAGTFPHGLAVARLNPDGTLDQTFADGGRRWHLGMNGEVVAATVDPQGRLVVANYWSGVYLTRYTPDGRPDTTFGPDRNGIAYLRVESPGVEPMVVGVAVRDGKIIVGDSAFNLFRFNDDGSADAAFGTGGRAALDPTPDSDTAHSMHVATDGKILVGGRGGDIESGPGPTGGAAGVVVRALPDGTRDPAFGRAGVRTDRYYHFPLDSELAVGAQGDGKVVVFGSANTPAGQVDFAVSRLRADGALDGSFGGPTGGNSPASPPGRAVADFALRGTSAARSVAVQPDGKAVVLGDAGGPGDVVLARYNPDGSLDPSFGEGGRVIVPPFGAGGGRLAFPTTVQAQPDGKILVGARAQTGMSAMPNVVARLNGDGSFDAAFGTGGIALVPGGRGDIRHLLVQGDGRIVVLLVDGVIARLNADGSSDTSFGGGNGWTDRTPVGTSLYSAALQGDGKIVAAGTENTVGMYVVRFTADGVLDTTFSGDGVSSGAAPGFGAAVAVQPNGRIVVGGFDGVVARFNANGTLDSGFGNNGWLVHGGVGTVRALGLGDGGRIYGAGFHEDIFSDHAVTLFALNANGTPAAGFWTGGQLTYLFPDAPGGEDASVNAAGFTPDGRVVVVGQSEDDFAVARFHLSPAGTVRVQVVEAPASVVGRHAFYNNSAFDGGNASAGDDDDAAIATDKAALLPGEAAGFANVTGYLRGINGIMVDVMGLPAGTGLSADDFSVRWGRTADRSAFAAGPAPVAVAVRRGAGANGSDRVTLVFRDYNPADLSPIPQAVANGWLEVTLKANDRTGLERPDVFSFGNLIGEAGDGGGAAGWRVSALDLAAVKRAMNSVSPATAPTDFNRDGRTNALDLAIVRRALGRGLPLLTPAQTGQLSRPDRIAEQVLFPVS